MSRLFTAKNAPGSSVYDVETGEQLEHVISVDSDRGVANVAHHPLRLVGDEIDTYEARFRTIHPIYGGAPMPVLFPCYGRLG